MRHPPEQRPRWQQVQERRQRGETPRQIAEALGISASEVSNSINVAGAHAARFAWRRETARAKLAAQMARAYEDPRARAWIYRQMGVSDGGERSQGEDGSGGAVVSGGDQCAAGRG